MKTSAPLPEQRNHRSAMMMEHQERCTKASASSSRVRCKKKRRRPLERLRPKRAAFLRTVRRIDPNRLVFLDESWLSVTMSRSHAWVKRGQEFIDRVPMNRGRNLTLSVPSSQGLGLLNTI
jgi:hypothetical protein